MSAITRRRRILLAAAFVLMGVAPSAWAQGPVVTSVVNAASLDADLAPGTIAFVFGEGLTADGQACVANALPLPKDLCGTRLLVNDVEAAFFLASPQQLTVHVPVS